GPRPLRVAAGDLGSQTNGLRIVGDGQVVTSLRSVHVATIGIGLRGAAVQTDQDRIIGDGTIVVAVVKVKLGPQLMGILLGGIVGNQPDDLGEVRQSAVDVLLLPGLTGLLCIGDTSTEVGRGTYVRAKAGVADDSQASGYTLTEL